MSDHLTREVRDAVDQLGAGAGGVVLAYSDGTSLFHITAEVPLAADMGTVKAALRGCADRLAEAVHEQEALTYIVATSGSAALTWARGRGMGDAVRTVASAMQATGLLVRTQDRVLVLGSLDALDGALARALTASLEQSDYDLERIVEVPQ